MQIDEVILLLEPRLAMAFQVTSEFYNTIQDFAIAAQRI